MTIESLYDVYLRHPRVLTDTRKVDGDCLFFALRGPNHNANRFLKQALEAGAAYAVTDEDPGFEDDRVIRVDDVLSTLQSLALHHRMRFDIPVIAITGSNGKTTTKELVHAVLSAAYRTHTTKGNLNNHIGIPLTLLAMPFDTEMAVIEMGANHQREIASYCTYVRPTHGLITNCGKAHLEGFGGIEGVRKGKGELFDFLRSDGGTAFVMGDYEYLRDMCKGIRTIVTYGSSDAEVTGRVLSSEPYLAVRVEGTPDRDVQTKLVGDYNLPNVLAAVAVGRRFGVPDEYIAAAIEGYTPSNNRSQMAEAGGNRLILDAYNANPNSMRAAIENMAAQKHPRKMAFLGAMMELGEDSVREHGEVIALLNRFQWETVALVGGDFANIEHGYLYFNDSAEAAQWVRRNPPKDALILVKGSRSMQMEKVAESVMKPNG
jgi:UDP-N-acetylmuramoyl-tripeptide--D-alanyl-D-alanine ligase